MISEVEDNGYPCSLTECELKHEFEKCEGARSHLHYRWEDYAGWTLPYVFPNDELTSTTEMQNDYQSVGAQAVNHLTNKIVSTLFNPSRPFFRLELTDKQEAVLQGMGIEGSDITELTALTEKSAMRQMEKVGLRTSILTGIKSLIVTGNTLLYTPPGMTKAQVYSLRDYVIKRDMSGNMAVLITRDTHQVSTLEKELHDLVKEIGRASCRERV